MDNTWVCVAAKNEAETIGGLVRRLTVLGLNVVVTDDGSDDETYYEATRAGAYLARHSRCRGIAQSVMDAWGVALDLGAEWIVQMDAGGSHEPGHALALAQCLQRREVDVLIGSRFLLHSRYYGRPWRALMSRLASLACSIKVGHWLTDWTSGLRAFRASAVDYLLNFCEYEARMHGWQIEVLAKAIKAGMAVDDLPIAYTAGESSFDLSVAREAFQIWRRL